MKRTDKLRVHAEKKLQKAKEKGQVPESDSKMVHELQVHQIELEMQNEELRESQRQYQELSQKYFDLYNFAPVGYFTLDKNGIILDVNLTAESLLGITKPNLINMAFILFIKPQFRNLFYNKINETIETRLKHEFELELIRKDKTTFWALIALNFTEDEKYYRITVTDITERKKAEKALKESEDKFSKVFYANPAAVSISDGDGNFIEANESFLKLTGYNGDELIGHTTVELNLLDVEKREQDLTEFKEKGSIKDLEFEMRTKFGEKRNILGSGEFLEINGKIRVIYFIYDITERKLMEEELIKAHDNLEEKVEERTLELKLASAYNRSLIESSLDPLVTIGPDGKITDVNTATELVTGYSRDELIGTDFLDYFTEPQKAKSGYHKVFKDGEVRDYPLEIKHRNGSLTPVLYNASVYRNEYGEVIGVFAAARDITELKKSEEQVKERALELQTERDNLNSILNTTKSGVYIVNSDFELEYINSIIEKEFGLFKGQKCYEYFYNEQDICSNCKIQKAFEGNIVEWEQNRFNTNKTYDILATPINNSDGSISVLVFLYDVTRRDKAEKELKTTINELKRSNRELQSFAYITSHDLQEPLRTMGSYAGLLKHRYGGKLDSDADDFIDYMVSGAVRLQDMIKGLLEYSRVGTQGEEFSKVSSEEALNKGLFNLHSSIEECHAKVTYDTLPVVLGDESQITQVFQNLIGNGLKFRRNEIQPKIHVSAEKKDNKYIFSISDNGIGMEPQYTDRIFEVFKRMHPIGEYEGAGIGLAIVKRIIERHGGRIWVESEYGVGSTFYFTIPFKS